MTEVQDWLETAPEQESEPETDWLGLQIPKTKIPYDELRFSCMRGSGRVWACDGEYVAYRPYNHVLDQHVNPKTAERHSNFLASGHYEHVGTFDEVQIFKLLDGSPFKRNTKTFIPGQNLHQDCRQAAIAACERDWVLYHDILDTIASGLKTHLTAALAQTVYEDCLGSIFVSIQQRGGPLQAEVDAGFANVRQKRGYGTGKVMLLPAAQPLVLRR